MRLPKPLARRGILYGPDTPKAKVVELGREYLAAGFTFDAAECFARAHDVEGLKEIRSIAINTGDAFLLRTVYLAREDLATAADWESLGARARELGKDAYAERAAAGGTPPAPPLQDEADAEAEMREKLA